MPTGLVRTFRHLREPELDDLVAAYRDGATVYELAEQFDIHRTTAGQHLRARGVDTKPPGLTPEEVPAAAALYRQGWSLAKIGEQYGTTDNTVRHWLLKAGVRMRPARGRQRQEP